MQNFINFLLIFVCFCFCSCSGQDVDIQLTIYNKSGKVLDSLLIYDVFEKKTMYYNVPADTVIVKKYHGKKALIPKGERGVLTLVVFDKDMYYTMTNGFIGFPTAYLEEEYSFYIYNEYITTKKDFKPQRIHKYKIAEMPKKVLKD